MAPAEQRHRKLFPWFVLGMLIYGRHSCVAWSGQYTCHINAPMFAKTLSTSTARLRGALEYLRRSRVVKDLDWGHGFIKLTIAQPVQREEIAA